MSRHFNRFELKYEISAAKADALIEDIKEQTTVDTAGGPTGTYQITSLYFDSEDLAFYRAKIEGIKFRRKLRIRRYGPLTCPASDAVEPVHVEIKQRINRTTQKRRITLPFDDAFALCTGARTLELADPGDATVAGEIEFLVRSVVLKPACAISYIRQAFVGSVYERGLRITFDRNLWCRDPEFGLDADGPRQVFLPHDRVILEVKADNAVPLWVARMLARHGCTVDRFSKYCAGIRKLRSLPPIGASRGAEE